MSAKHALLGLLLDRPAYRYQLGDRLEKGPGPAWAINSGQLYQTTKRLEKEGLIERVASATEDQDRDDFAITDDGAEEFERWFSAETSGARLLRRPLLVKIALAGPRRLKEGALELIDAYERGGAARLKDLSTEQEEISLRGHRVRADHVLLRLGLSAD